MQTPFIPNESKNPIILHFGYLKMAVRIAIGMAPVNPTKILRITV
jgi:hypothetical protein